MAPAYILGRAADPIFAVLVGVSAAILRINREELAKGKTPTDSFNLAWGYFRPSFLFSLLVHFISMCSVREGGIRMMQLTLICLCCRRIKKEIKLSQNTNKQNI